MSLPSINFLHLTVSEIQPGQTFSRRPPSHPPARTPAHPDTMGENNTPTALQGCGVKMEQSVPQLLIVEYIITQCGGRRIKYETVNII